MNTAKYILIVLLFLPSFSYAELLSIQVKQTFLRAKPSFLSKVIAKVQYAQQLEKKKVKNSWYLVKSIQGKYIGWIHSSALSKKTIVLKSSQKIANSSVSQSEVLMAGKGFNKQVETEYKRQNRRLDFTLVDKIENKKYLNRSQLIHFAKNGKLSI